MNNTTKTILYVVGGLALAVGGYFLYKKFSKNEPNIDENKVTAESKQSKIQFVRE
jgi:LPXTG-motif cell wall-anchored protein